MNTNNCFRNVLNLIGLNGNMQDNGSDSAFLLLSAMADNMDILIANSVNSDDTYTNQCQEVLHRLKPYMGFGWQRLARLLNDYDSSVSAVL